MRYLPLTQPDRAEMLAVIGASTEVVNCVVGPAARIGDGARLEEAVVGDQAVIADGCQVPPGTTVACRARL